MSRTEVELQRQYYAETAHRYNELHIHDKDEHFLALSFLTGILDFLEARSVLDIGSGTGRTLLYFKQYKPNVRVTGIEPVKELREVGFSLGLSENELIDGDATALEFVDGAFDVVCEFAVLHHVREPEKVVAEMLRVARKAIFISDANNFGQGSYLLRSTKQILNSLGLWGVANRIKTRGKGYQFSKEDGLSYSYSVFNNYQQIRRVCRSVHVLNTKGGKINPYRTARQVALLGIKE